MGVGRIFSEGEIVDFSLGEIVNSQLETTKITFFAKNLTKKRQLSISIGAKAPPRPPFDVHIWERSKSSLPRKA